MIRARYITPALLLLFACQTSTPGGQDSTSARPQAVVETFDQNRLGDYWYQGEAEITRFELSQNRYADLHPGEAIAVFVTEDFLTDRQVKNDSYQSPRSVSVLKTNLIRRFSTGLYDYSIMTSVFTPVNNPKWPATLKVTTSAQDWCGQSFMQLNYRDDAYHLQLNSYFEAEGDERGEIGRAVLEDELLNRIRINPDALPTGEIQVFPSTVIVRLMHLPFEPVDARASRFAYAGTAFEGEKLQVYRLEYPSLQRTYDIVFEGVAPYRIAGWEDTYPSMFDKALRTTTARRTGVIKSPYWQKNALEDGALRKELGISE